MVSGKVPLFVNNTDCTSVEYPSAMVPKDKLVAEKVAVPPIPVPERVMLCGDVDVLSVRVTAAVSAPGTVGAKRTPIVQVAPAAMLAPHVFEVANEVGLAPPSAMLLK
jgi:hypothetical protein